MALFSVLLSLPLQAGVGAAVPFDAPTTVLPRDERFEALLDLDGDGDLDAVGWAFREGLWNKPTLSTYLDPASAPYLSAGFQLDLSAVAGPHTATQPYPSFSAVADFDQDGRDDLALSLRGALVMLRSSGAPGEMEVLSSFAPAGSDIGGVVARDLDGDGDVDVATASAELRLFLNLGGAQGFGFGPTLATPGPTPTLAALELDGQPGADLAIARADELVVVPVASGVLGAQQVFATGLADGMVTAGDVDGDGDDDLAVFAMAGEYRLARQGPAGTLVLEPARTGGPATRLADVNGDGALDGVCCGGGGSSLVNTGASFFEISPGDGAGGFAPAFRVPSVGSHHLAGVGDLDGDGQVDLAGGRCLLRPRGPLVAALSIDLGLPEGQPGPSPSEIVDAEGDGDPEYRLATDGCTINLADGNHAVASGLPAPHGLAWGGGGFPCDWDGDGDTDLLASVVDATGAHLVTLRVESLGGKLFEAGPAAAGGLDLDLTEFLWSNLDALDEPEACRVGDLEGDGDLDIVVNRVDSTDRCRVYTNDGAGRFAQVADLPLDAAALADFNGDGLLDVLGEGSNGPFGSSNAEVWLADRAGGWQYHVTLAFNGLAIDEWEPAMQPAVSDFDGDGDLDVALFGDYLDRNGVHWNDGAAGFAFAAFTASIPALVGVSGNYQGDDEVFGAFAVEVDGDALPELLVGPLLLGPGPKNYLDQHPSWAVVDVDAQGGFSLLAVHQLDPSAAADVDGDGDTDAVGRSVVRAALYLAPDDGLRQQYGSGTPGSAGVVPTLGLAGSPRELEPIGFRLRGALGGALTWFAFSLGAPTPPVEAMPGMLAYLNPAAYVLVPLTATGPAGAPGDGGFDLSIVVPPGIGGLEVVHQVFVVDPAAANSLASSAALRVVYGG